MKRALLPILLVCLASCVSNEPPPRTREQFTSAPAAEFTLPASWWHDSMLAEPLSLTGEQFQKLDALQEQEEDVAKLERDGMVSARELRSVIEGPNVPAADIVEAGKNLRAMRETLLEKQIALVAAEREILTRDQWQKLQQALDEERRPRRGDREGREGREGRGPGGRGRGGWGGGRRPF